MPNRIIKDSILTSDKINSLSFFEYTLWTALILLADDYGRFHANPLIIKGYAFALRPEVSPDDIEAGLKSLVEHDCIKTYTHGGKNYLYFPNWTEHQRLRNRKSKFPEPPLELENCQNDIAASCGQLPPNAASCGDVRRVAARAGAESESESESEIESEIESESEKKQNPNLSLITNKSQETGINYEQVNILFDRLWKLYPKQVGKGQVTMEEKVAMFEIGFERVAKAIRAYRRECEESEREYKFIKNGSTFFNGAWRDYLPPAPPPRDPNKRYDEEGRELNSAGYPIIDFGLSKAGNDF